MIRLAILGFTLAAALLLAALFWYRLDAVLAFARIAPATAQTTGCEEESFYAVWRASRGHKVYADTSQVPFASAYFNWLFYSSYSCAVLPMITEQGDGALPLAGRIFTLGGALLGAVAAGILFYRVAEPDSNLRWLCAVLGGSLFFGPLVGWWAFTVRPDVWALTFEVLGIGLLLLLYRKWPLLAVIGCAVCSYLAWAFKHNFVSALGAAGLFLLVRRDWRGALVLSVLSIGLWTATIGVLGSDYVRALRESAGSAEYQFSTGIESARLAALKTLPTLVLVPWFARTFLLSLRPSPLVGLRHDALALGGLGTLIAMAIAVPSACKDGATANYFFSANFLLSLYTCAALPTIPSRWAPLLSAAVLVAVLAAPLTGRFGILDLRPNAANLGVRWMDWQKQPEPRFSSDLRLNLPWLSRESPPFVLAFNYPRERARGRVFESGGIGGLIEQGYFASLLLPKDTGNQYDNGCLDRYRRVGEAGHLALYHRVSLPEPAGDHD